MNTKQPVSIISAALKNPGCPFKNDWRHDNLLELVEKQFPEKFLECEGVYEGVSEQSVIISHSGGVAGTAWQDIIAIAKRFDQESILHVGSDRYASLYYVNTSAWVPLGKFQQVKEEQALNSKAYTKVGDIYYQAG